MTNNFPKGLSVCFIVKNEEAMIGQAIESIKDVANQIVVVDTGSSDKTLEIIKRYNCDIFSIEWKDNFSLARNFSISKAKYSHILILDADERVQNPNVLKELIDNSSDEIGGYILELTSISEKENNVNNKFISNLLRIIQNNPNIYFEGVIHEQVISSILKCDLKLDLCEVQILHLGYNLSSDQMLAKQQRNLQLLTNALNKSPDDAYLLYQISKTYLSLGNLDSAAQMINLALTNTNSTSFNRPQSLNYASYIALCQHKIDLASKYAQESLLLIPDQVFALFLLGELSLVKSNFKDALNYFSRIEEVEQNKNILAKIYGEYYLSPEQLQYRIGRSYMGLKQYDKALLAFQKGHFANLMDINNLMGIANIYYFEGNFEKSKEYLLEAKQIAPTNQQVQNYLITVENEIIKQNSFNRQTNEVLFSLSMIVKNEEKMLEGCLESVRGLVDEIVICDTGSSDKTLEIAEKFGAKIIKSTWKNDFSEARNQSLKHCTGKWILYLDADERLSKIDIAKFRNLLQNLDDNVGMLICTIESDHVNWSGEVEKHRGGYPRIFKNIGYPKVHFKGRVHEQISPSLKDAGYQMISTDIVVHHLGYNQTKEIMEQKVKRNYSLLLDHVKEEPFNGYAWYQLGQTLAQMGIKDQAENAIRFSLENGELSQSVKASAAATLSQLLGNRKQFEESLYWANLSLSIAEDVLYTLNLKAYSLLYLNRFEESEQAFLEALKISEKSNSSIPNAGFDVAIPKDIILQGLEKAQIYKKTKSSVGNS